jgi:hypothetical protein
MRPAPSTPASARPHHRHHPGGPRASSVAGPASSSKPVEKISASSCGQRSSLTDAGRVYVEAVLNRYCWLPGTPTRTSRHDRRLAAMLYERGLPLAIVQMALLTGAARRTFRKADALPLPPIRTLHYFLPLIEEMLEDPPAPGYIQYLEGKLLPYADAKAEKLLHSG